MLNQAISTTKRVEGSTTVGFTLTPAPSGRANERLLKERVAAALLRLPDNFLPCFFEVYPKYLKYKYQVHNVKKGRALYPEIIEKFEEFATWLENYKQAMSMY